MNDDNFRGTTSLNPPTANPGDRMGAGGRESRNPLTDRVGEVASQGLQQAKDLGATTRVRVLREVDQRKDALAQRLEKLAGSIDDVALRTGLQDDLQTHVVDRAARTVRNVSQALSTHTTSELFTAAGQKVRERPGLFLAGCLAMGFLGARLLRR